jgi:hypothetical protein
MATPDWLKSEGIAKPLKEAASCVIKTSLSKQKRQENILKRQCEES